jgi:hypothetical protein
MSALLQKTALNRGPGFNPVVTPSTGRWSEGRIGDLHCPPAWPKQPGSERALHACAKPEVSGSAPAGDPNRCGPPLKSGHCNRVIFALPPLVRSTPS